MLRRCLVSVVCCLVFGAVVSSGAFAQRGEGIFATPVPNAPFYGMVQVQRSYVRPNGTVTVLQSTHLMARNSAGEIYTEMRSMVPLSSNKIPELLGALIYDPQTRTSTRLFPKRRWYRSFPVKRPPATEPPNQLEASPVGSSLPSSQFTREVDLGSRKMDGLEAHGVREVQTIPANGTNPAVTVTDEYWYSYLLHINLMVKHMDPRTGSIEATVTQLSLSDPDASLFTIPDGYKPFGAKQ